MKEKLRRAPRAVIIGCVLAALLVVGALAYLSVSGGTVANTFQPADDPAPTITESFDGITKENVKVHVGDPGYAVYVRAAIVVNWEMDGEGNENNFHATAPKLGIDYTLDLNNGDWFEYNGFYYHKAMVASGETAALITNCTLAEGVTPPAGYHLSVEIIAQTIQALGATDDGDIPAVTNAWGVSVDSNKNLTPPTS